MEKDYLLEKWLNNDLTDAERHIFVQRNDFEFNQQILKDAKTFGASSFSTVSDFHQFKEYYRSQQQLSKRLDWITPMLRIAAVVLVAAFLYFTLFDKDLTTVHTLAAEKVNIELPDKSEITLNALSKIVYNERKWTENRYIDLDGEAFFKVAKGEKFDVKTKDGLVTVVGTQFNVKQRLGYFEVNCLEGRVEVKTKTTTMLLEAGKSFKVLNGQFTTTETVLGEPQWINNTSIFNSIPYVYVLDEIERQYDVKVVRKDIDVKRLFTGGFSHNNLNDALTSVTQPMGLAYRINTSNEVVIHEEKD